MAVKAEQFRDQFLDLSSEMWPMAITMKRDAEEDMSHQVCQ